MNHSHPRESFAIKHIAYFDRDVSRLVPDGFWDGALMEKSMEECKCGFCHEPTSKDDPFIYDGQRPLLRLRREALLSTTPSAGRDYFHRPYFWAHERCALYSPEVYLGSQGWFNVALALHRGKSLRCAGCKRNGATVGCFEWRCDRSFHVGCTRISTAELKAGTIFWCPAHDRIRGGVAGYEDLWTCDHCKVALPEGTQVYSCGQCIDYYNSYDLCVKCYEIGLEDGAESETIEGTKRENSGHWIHNHIRTAFFIRTIRPSYEGDGSIAKIRANSNLAIDRSMGPALCDLFSMDWTCTVLDIHGRAPRCIYAKITFCGLFLRGYT